MKAVQRVLVAGAFGGLAAAAIAASGAFACSATSSVSVSGPLAAPMPNPVIAGSTIDVHVDDFYETGVGTVSAGSEVVSEVTITWLFPSASPTGPWSGPVLGSIPSPKWVSDNGPTVTRQFTIPEVRPSDQSHYVRAEQSINGVPVFTRTFPVVIRDTTPATTTATFPTTVTNAAPPITPTTVGSSPTVKDNTETPLVTTRPAARPAPGADAGSSQPRVGEIRTFARPDAPYAVDAPVAPARSEPLPAGQPSASPAGPTAAEGQASALAPDDLWSGLKPGTGPSLIEPLPASSGGPNPLGGVLLGAGLVAMAGVAAVSGRRRLVLRRAS